MYTRVAGFRVGKVLALNEGVCGEVMIITKASGKGYAGTLVKTGVGEYLRNERQGVRLALGVKLTEKKKGGLIY